MAAASESESDRQKRIGELLVEMGFIDDDQLRVALERQRECGRRLGWVLIRSGFMSESRLVRGLSRQLKVDICDPISTPVQERVRMMIPRDLALDLRVVPIAVKVDNGRQILYVATADPLNFSAQARLEETAGMEIKWLLAGETEIDLALARHYGKAPADLDDPRSFGEPVRAMASPQTSTTPPERMSSRPASSGFGDDPRSTWIANAERMRSPSASMDKRAESSVVRFDLEAVSDQDDIPVATDAMAYDTKKTSVVTPSQADISTEDLEKHALRNPAFGGSAADNGITPMSTPHVRVPITDDLEVPMDPSAKVAQARDLLSRFAHGDLADREEQAYILRLIAAVITDPQMVSDKTLERALSSSSKHDTLRPVKTDSRGK